jgi:dTMP kinase
MFITFEGPEGSGKTTQYRRIVAALQAAGADVLATREPGGTSIGEQVRDIVLNRLDNTMMSPRAEALLFSAARAQHVDELIRPALAAGAAGRLRPLLRFDPGLSGLGHGLDLDALRRVTTFATGGLVPDVTIYLDCPPEVGLRRKVAQAEWNRLDALALEFHQRVYAGFARLIEADPARWLCIDATPGPDAVYTQIAAALRQRGLPL